MANITKTFTYDLPDEYLAQTNADGNTASWTYEGPAYLYVFVRNSDGAFQCSQSYMPVNSATDQQDTAQIKAGLDQTAVLLDTANSDTDALIASLLITKDTGESTGYPQKEYALADGTVHYKRPNPQPPDHTYQVDEITYDLGNNSWKQPFPWHKPWTTIAIHTAARDAGLAGAQARLTEYDANLTDAQKTAAQAFITEMTDLYTTYATVVAADAPHMIPFPSDPTLELIPNYDYNTDPDGRLNDAATDGQ